MLAYRGVPGPIASKLKVGDTYLDFGYQSTGAKATALKFAELEATSKTKYMFRFHLKKGLTKTATFSDEIVLNRGYTSKVTGISKSGNTVIIDMDGSVAAAKQAAGKTTVGTSFTDTVSKEFKESVEKQIAAYPEKVKVALNENGISFAAGSRVTEVFPRLKGVHPRGWPAGSTWDSCEGLYSSKSRQINISESYRPIRSKVFTAVPEKRKLGVLNHETGHAFDHTLRMQAVERLEEFKVHSETPKFRTVYKLDKKNFTPEMKFDFKYQLQGGDAGPSETFAEVFADVMGQGASFDRSVSKAFPNVTKYIEDLLK